MLSVDVIFTEPVALVIMTAGLVMRCSRFGATRFDLKGLRIVHTNIDHRLYSYAVKCSGNDTTPSPQSAHIRTSLATPQKSPVQQPVVATSNCTIDAVHIYR